jgi:hypothetical protein
VLHDTKNHDRGESLKVKEELDKMSFAGDLSAYLVEMPRCNGENVDICFDLFLSFAFPKCGDTTSFL